MNTCDTCKHWEGQAISTSYGEENPLIELYGCCNNPKVNGTHDLQHSFPDGGHRFWRHSAATKDASPEWVKLNGIEMDGNHTVPLDQASPEASDDYGLCFTTGPKFGCVHWESK